MEWLGMDRGLGYGSGEIGVELGYCWIIDGFGGLDGIS